MDARERMEAVTSTRVTCHNTGKRGIHFDTGTVVISNEGDDAAYMERVAASVRAGMQAVRERLQAAEKKE